ncbi:hypothetical protein CKAN_00547700 [Cinnamomum micranthum f. kanehirae]|uniref:Uncharacterized protein n=1 Tax=Cinnamomum micranthum f. kanehirae TaxID=337451 RepID=A0A443NEN1_9MAGN|nr:hypothetical protein CKAN_00547700 [Cinnamomum micranthum f. kanehirae]
MQLGVFLAPVWRLGAEMRWGALKGLGEKMVVEKWPVFFLEISPEGNLQVTCDSIQSILTLKW